MAVISHAVTLKTQTMPQWRVTFVRSGSDIHVSVTGDSLRHEAESSIDLDWFREFVEALVEMVDQADSAIDEELNQRPG